MGPRHKSNLRVHRLLHAGYIFETARAKIIFDPIFENPFCGNGFSYPPVEFDLEQIRNQKFTAVFISHIHEDHFSSKSLDLIAKETPIFLYSNDLSYSSFLHEMGFKDVRLLKIHDLIEVEDIKLFVIKALDENVDSIFSVEVGDTRILNVVDSWIHPDEMNYLQSEEWDLVIWPFQTFREWEVLAPTRYLNENRDYPLELLEQLGSLPAKNVVASACQFIQDSWWNLKKDYFTNTYCNFEKQLENLRGGSGLFQFIRLDPGESLKKQELGWEKGERLSYVHLRQAKKLDYDFSGSESPAPMRVEEISSHLPKLVPAALDKLLQRLSAFHLELKNNLDFEGSFFREDKIWNLRIWLVPGKHIDFRFKICGQEVQKWVASEASFDWLTEISAYKLARAFNHEELLNSLYLQINGQDAKLHQLELGRDWEVLEDPLIRFLSNFNPLDYQRRLLELARSNSEVRDLSSEGVSSKIRI